MKNHTINICLIPRGEIYTICKKLNSLDRGNYNRNSREFIPHATLGMKTLSDEQVQSLYGEIQDLSLEKQESSILGYYAREVPHTGLWTGITIEKTPGIYELQKAVLDISKKYQDQERTQQTYAIDEFYEENEIHFFPEEEYLARDSLHITLGKQDIETDYNNENIPENISFERLVIGKIGNYGSVREILFEIALQ